MYAPMPEDAPDPYRLGWIPPAAAHDPRQPLPPYRAYTAPPAPYAAPYLPPYSAPPYSTPPYSVAYPLPYSLPLPRQRCDDAVVSLV